MPASTIPRRSIQTTEPFTNVHSITPAPKLSAGQTKSIDATMLRCPTTSTATSSPRSEQDNDNTSETSSTETMSAESCETFCTTRQYPSPSEKPCDSFPSSDDPPVHLDRIYQDNLCVEMLSLFETLLPSRESYERRMNLVRKIEDLLNAEWPAHDIRVHLFGSSVNDLGTSYSDVDLCITTPWHGLRNVRTLAKMFRKCGMQNVVCVPRAKVPIVRLFDPESQLACDINVNNTLALHNTEMIKTYVALDPRVRPLIMILKHWTKQRRINDAANGGTLSTYTWTCMVINFLQMRNPPILPVLHQMVQGEDDSAFCTDVESLRGFGSKNHESLGGLLFAFFRRYAVEFNYEEQVVSVRYGRYLDKREKGWHIGRNRQSLCVEEPFNVTRNLGNSADEASVRGLINEFRRAFHLLLEHASLDLICEPYRPALQEHSPPDLNSVISSQSLAPPPPVMLPVHPHSIDTRRRQSQISEEMYGPNSYPFNTSPSATYSIPFTQHNQLAADKGYRSRFNSSTIPAQATTSPPFRLRNARFSSHPMPYCTTMSNGVPIAITIALPPPSSYANPQSTTAQGAPNAERPTVDHIFARYTNQPMDQTDGGSQRLNYQGRRRSSASSYYKRSPSRNHRRQSVLSQRRRSSTAEWPAISPSSSTVRSTPQPPQPSQTRSRRRWSTVKKSTDVPTVPVKPKEVKPEETPKQRGRSQQQQPQQQQHHHQHQQQQQPQLPQSSRNKKTGLKQKKSNKSTSDNKRS